MEIDLSVCGIDKIIFNDKFTKVIFVDGRSECVIRKDSDANDHEVAVIYCIMKRLYPGFKTGLRKKIEEAEAFEKKTQETRLAKLEKKNKKKEESK